MKSTLNLVVFLYAALQCIMMPGCKKAEDITAGTAKPETKLTAVLPNSQIRIKTIHLYRDTVYTLSEDFTREDGEQLVIDAGTLIKVNTGGNTSITIKPGGIIVAKGTSTDPIVFTSNNLQASQRGNWNGILIIGKSLNNQNSQQGTAEDSSGLLSYVRVEFAGLKLRSVGSHTTINNLQVSYCNTQSSFEIEGGTFNAKNLVSYALEGPADFYITKGYTGRMQNLLAYRHPYFGSNNNNYPYNTLCGVFIENNPNDPAAIPNTFPVISNITVLGPDNQNGTSAFYGDTLNNRSASLVTTMNAYFYIKNSLFMGYPEGGWYLDDYSTAFNINNIKAGVANSIFHSNDSSRIFYLLPGSYDPYSSVDFKNFEMEDRFHNKVFAASADFNLTDPFNYTQPSPYPLPGSPILEGANFDGQVYEDVFFDKVSYIGAIGKDNWLNGWTNFRSLTTNYNFPD